jgi:hypothetical protein
VKETPTPIKRQLLLAGLLVLIVVLFVFVSVTIATSRNTSPSQYETEPNDDFDDASIVYVPGHIMGSAWNSFTDTDYFVMEATIGEQYQAETIIGSPDDLPLEMRLYDGALNFVTATSFSTSSIEFSWTAYTTIYYIRIAAPVLTQTLQTAVYLLSIDLVSQPTPPPTFTPSPTPPPTATPSPSPLEIIRVATTGSDVPDCGSTVTPCRTVQYAVDIAQLGGEIRVAAGVYTGVQTRAGGTQVVHIGKTVTVRGGYTTTDWDIADPEANPTTLYAQGLGRVLSITGNITPTVEGLILVGGDAAGLGGTSTGSDAGGGVYVNAAKATISNCVIFDNTASTADRGFGGGLYLLDSASTLVSNTVISNTASTAAAGYGGGLYLLNSAAVLQNNMIQGNTSSTATWGVGGGLFLWYSDAMLQGNTIQNNTASTASLGLGGGLFFDRNDATLQNNTIANNIGSTAAEGQGGGVYLSDSDAMFVGNTVRDNIASTADNGTGGGLYLGGATTLNSNTIISNVATSNPTATGRGGGLYMGTPNSFTLTNNLIASNHANTEGSGLWIEVYSSGFTSGRLSHNTIADNHGSGQGVYMDGYTTLIFTNTIISGHSVGITVTTGNTATLEGTLWYNNGTDTAGGGTILTGTVNIYDDPVFVNPATWNYHLDVDSPAINAGVDADVLVDIDGDPRFWPYDIGADEFVERLYLPVVRRN